MTKNLVYIFSFVIALGSLADLLANGLVEVLAIIIGVSIVFQKKYIESIYKYLYKAIPLFMILFILFFAGINYGFSSSEIHDFNFKFLLAILIYIVFSAFFEQDNSNISKSLLFFGFGTALLGFLYFFNLIDDGFEIRNERLLFLGENPNSLSVRISLGVLVFVWYILNKSLKRGILFYLILLTSLPLMFSLIIASGSKGSFLLCIASVILLVLISDNISKKNKIFTVFLLFFGFLLIYDFLISSNLYNRFVNSTLTTGRSDIWQESLEIFLIKPFGVGESGYLNEIKIRFGESIDTHNLFIYLLVTGGFLSFLLFVYFYFALLRKSLSTFKLNRDPFFFILWISIFFIINKTGGVLSYLVMWYFLSMINSQKDSLLKPKIQLKKQQNDDK